MTAVELPLEVDIRLTRLEERTASAEIAVRAFAHLGSFLEPSERARLSDRVRASTMKPDPAEGIVAITDNRVVGSVVYNRPGSADHPLLPADWAFFRALAVDPAWAGQGIGRRLVEACIARARSQGGAGIGLNVADVNEIAVCLYRRMGFTMVGDAFQNLGVAYRTYGLDLINESRDV